MVGSFDPHLPSPGAARGPKQHPLLCAGAESGLGAQMVDEMAHSRISLDLEPSKFEGISYDFI